MERFFSKFGWVICLVLTVILTAVVASKFFSLFAVVVGLVVLVILTCLTVILYAFRRYFVNVILISILLVSVTTLVYTTGIFNGYIDVAIKGIEIKQNVEVGGDVLVNGNVKVEENVEIGGDVKVDGSVVVKENVEVQGDVIVDGGVIVKENVEVQGDVVVDGSVVIKEDLQIEGDVNIAGDVNVDGNVNITKDINVGGDVNVEGNIIPTTEPTTETTTQPTIEPTTETITEPVVVDTTVYVKSVTLSPETISVKEGTSTILSAKVAPYNATNSNITWRSDDVSVVTVSSTGKITAVSEGTAVITVETVQGGCTDTCIVTVKSNAIVVTSVTISPSTLNLKVEENYSLSAKVAPYNATNVNVIWSSSNSSVATVSSNGRITAVSEGTAIVTVETVQGGLTDTCVITVKENEVIVQNASAKITFADHVEGSTQIFASVVISESGKTPEIESNLKCSVVKISETVYHVCVEIAEGSHGTVAIYVSGNGITTAEVSRTY